MLSICSVDSDISVDSVMSEFSESVVVISRESLTGVNPKMEAGLDCRGLNVFGEEMLGTRVDKFCSGLLHSSMLFVEDIGRLEENKAKIKIKSINTKYTQSS